MRISHTIKNLLHSIMRTPEMQGELIRALESPAGYDSTIGPRVNIDAKITIGASGAVSSTSGSGITSTTKLATGIYQINLADVYNQISQITGHVESPVGSTVTAGSFVTDTLYQILTVGTTDYSSIGLASGLTATVGQCFVATGAGSGTGTAKEVGNTGVMNIEVAPGYSNMLAPSSGGSIFIIQVLDNTGALVSPVDGSIISLRIVGGYTTFDYEN